MVFFAVNCSDGEYLGFKDADGSIHYLSSGSSGDSPFRGYISVTSPTEPALPTPTTAGWFWIISSVPSNDYEWNGFTVNAGDRIVDNGTSIEVITSDEYVSRQGDSMMGDLALSYESPELKLIDTNAASIVNHAKLEVTNDECTLALGEDGITYPHSIDIR